MKKIRIRLVEDNRILREGIAATIDGETDMRFVASSGGHDRTLLQVRKLRPDVVLLDVGLRNQNGMRVVKALTK
jgi:DNA-binding NarL/FixJ family response regulator